MVLNQRQRLPYCLCQPNRTSACCLGVILLILLLQQFGELLTEWSQDRSRHFYKTSDSLKKVDQCASFHSRDCTPMPIDLVYTWVNGTDVTLLMDLMMAKNQLAEEEGLLRKKPKCPLSECIAAPMVVLDPALPANITSQELPSILPSFLAAKAVLQYTKPLESADPVSVIVFHSKADAEKALTDTLKDDDKLSIFECYLTTEKDAPGLIQMQTVAYLSGFSESFIVSKDLRAKLPASITERITALELYPEDGIALLHFKTSQNLIDLLQEDTDKLKLEEEQLFISLVYLFWDLSTIVEYSQMHPAPAKKETRDFLTANRFEDNNALRYSLRSVEKHAPWVRHVFIVTNGQIPCWLNLSNPRVSIVTHREIFLNQSHLPTFSSPAIESNLHRIPGISQKFIYLNDDVMFGKDVWLDDFYTPFDGQKVYLAWLLPDCSNGCEGIWIKNGQCNQVCNNAACQWDGGDCKVSNTRYTRTIGEGDFFQANKMQVTNQSSGPAERPAQRGKKQITIQTLGRLAPVRITLHDSAPSNEDVLLLKIQSFQELFEEDGDFQKALMYETNGATTGRKLRDTFVDSLLYVDRLYTQRFGSAVRRVIAHAPHMIDKLVMQELQDTFPQDFQKTSSHHFRESTDMQFAFSYFYFLMSVKQRTNISEVFGTVDKDHSGVLSDSEIQALAMKIHTQPLKHGDLKRLENQLINCSKRLQKDVRSHPTMKPSQEPQITEELIMSCKPVADRIRNTFARRKYKYKVMNGDEVHFKMIQNDMAEVDRIFDDLYRRPRKFICINDDIDHTKSSAKEVKKKLVEFYQSMLPQPSQFELHDDMPNMFLHMDEHKKWKAYQTKLRFYRYCAIVLLVIFTLKLIATKIAHFKRKLLHKCQWAKYETLQLM